MNRPNDTIKINLELPVSLVQNSLRAIALLTLTLVIGSNSTHIMDPVIDEPPGPIPQIVQ